MILSRHLGFLFVKAKKVGGTSVEMALSTICRHPDDVVTPITPVDEVARRAMGGAPRNFARTAEDEADYLARIGTDAAVELRPKDLGFRNHMTLRTICRRIDPAGLRIVGIVRDPAAVVVSSANHAIGFRAYRRTGEAMAADAAALQRAVDEGLESGRWTGETLSDFYKWPDGSVSVEPLRHAHLEDDLAAFVRSLGCEAPPLPHAKKGLELSPEQAQQVLRPDQRRRVRELFAEDLARFGHLLQS